MGITEIAHNAIYSTLEKEYDPSEVLEYLMENTNFKTLKMILSEFMIKAGICKESDDEDTFIRKLSQQYTPYKEIDSKSKVRKVKRWFNETVSLGSRDTAIEICFSLKLNVEQTIEFLHKCGFHGLNVKSERDAIFLYCIINQRTINDAKRLLIEYENAINEEKKVEKNENEEIDINTATTNIMEQKLLENSDWDNDESFIKTFMLPNQSNFTNYSNTAIQEYYKLKNRVYINVILWNMKAEKGMLLNENEEEIGPKTMPFTWRFRNALKIYYNDLKKLGVNYSIKNDLMKCYDIAKEIEKSVLPIEGVENQRFLSNFLGYVMSSEDNLIRNVIPALVGEDNRSRSYGKSKLGSTILNEFLNGKKLNTWEQSEAEFYKNGAGRKALVFMYYLDFVYKWSQVIIDEEWDQISEDDELSYFSFFEGANNILKKCRLPLLYPANQFDWLILYSVLMFEKYEVDCDEENPVKYFQDVISISFNLQQEA